MNFNRERDPHRPLYHFSPPSGMWGGGPDGTVFHNGEYHVFYQHDPYMGSSSGNASWGHTCSRDLVHWEHRPIALGPTPFSADKYADFARSELVRDLDRSNTPPIVYDREVCFSGSAVIDRGVPTLIYTGFYHGVQDVPVMFTRTQCIATSTDGMLTWEKDPTNPVIAGPPEELVDPDLRNQPLAWNRQGKTDDKLTKGDITAWHDPHVWREGDSWYMALGCGFLEIGGAILLYQSEDLRKWQYLHPLCVGNDPSHNRWLVPDFFPLGGKHVLCTIATTRGRSQRAIYMVGSYENQRFIPEVEAVVDADPKACFHCHRTLLDANGRRIMFGALAERRPLRKIKQGWAGVLSLPRILELGPDNRLLMDPAPEVCSHHAPDWTIKDFELSPGSPLTPDGIEGDCLELAMAIETCEAEELSISLRTSPNREETTVFRYSRKTSTATLDTTLSTLDPDTVRSVDATPLALLSGEPLILRIFLDRSTIEIFANRRACLSGRTYPTREDSLGITISAQGGGSIIRSLQGWRKKPIFYPE